jgi:microcystin-dependent protein
MYAGSTEPDGWLFCDGTAVSRTSFSNLFSTIGTTFGGGNGSTTFNLPDMRSRMPVGVGAGTGLTFRSLGGAAGGETKVINSANLPTHTHSIDHDHPNTGSTTTSIWHQHGIGFSFFSHAAGGVVTARPDGGNPLTYNSVASDPAHSHNTDLGNLTGTSGNGGFANNPLDVMNPFLGLNFIIKV